MSVFNSRTARGAGGRRHILDRLESLKRSTTSCLDRWRVLNNDIPSGLSPGSSVALSLRLPAQGHGPR